jgi:hypothetical protein
MFDDPWEELTFRNVGNQGKIFNAVEDRFLLCLTHLHGYGSWDMVRNSIRRCDRFRFDFYLQSCSAEILGKRCELLMRAAERELSEMERKKQAADAMSTSSARPRSNADLNKERMVELTHQIGLEAKRLAVSRGQLSKLKVAGGPAAATATAASKATTGSASKDTAAAAKKLPAAAAGHSHTSASVVTVSTMGRPTSSTLPEGLLPELCKMLKKAGPDGMSKVVNEFVANHPEVSKRQTELKIFEVAVKERQEDDTKQIWHIRTEFEQFLHMENSYDSKASSSSSISGPKGGKSKEKEGKVLQVKRKRDEDGDEEEGEDGHKSKVAAGSTPGGGKKAPKKYKRAFGFFVKARRADAEEMIGDPSVRLSLSLSPPFL